MPGWALMVSCAPASSLLGNHTAAADKGAGALLRSPTEYKIHPALRLPPTINLPCFRQEPSSAVLIIWLGLSLLLSPAIAVFVFGKEKDIHGTWTLHVRAAKLGIQQVPCKIHISLPLPTGTSFLSLKNWKEKPTCPLPKTVVPLFLVINT